MPERLATIEAELAELRTDLALAVETILLAVVTGKNMSVEQVRAWVTKNLRND